LVWSVAVPPKVDEIIKLLERDGWRLARTTGSHRHYVHPVKPGLVTVAGKPSATSRPGTQEHPQAGRPARGVAMKGYVVVVEGDDESGFSTYSPDLPGVIAAAETKAETLSLMREAMAEQLPCCKHRDCLFPRRATPSTSPCSIPPPPDRRRVGAGPADHGGTGSVSSPAAVSCVEGW
jgi:predicted RNA binding protein YcfA (HicA-like mRNA interferase family)